MACLSAMHHYSYDQQDLVLILTGNHNYYLRVPKIRNPELLLPLVLSLPEARRPLAFMVVGV